MKPIILIGIALIVLGVVALVNRGITYSTQEKVLDIGPIEAITTKDKTIPLSPLLGVLSLVGGISLVVVGSVSKKV